MTQLLLFILEDLQNGSHKGKRVLLPEDTSSLLIMLSMHVLPRGDPLSKRSALGGTPPRDRISALRRARPGVPSLFERPPHRSIYHDAERRLSPVFGHRFVVTSAVKAARELVRNGDDTKMEVDDMRHAWSTFTNVLLERTVINTVYERDFAENDLKKCENCKINQQEVNLFKCAGCKSSMYCSKECQKVS